MPLGPNVLWVQVWTRAPELDRCVDNLGNHIQLQLHSLPWEGLALAGAGNKSKDLAFQLFLVMVYAGLTDRKAGGLLSWWQLLKCWGGWMSQRVVIASGTLSRKELIFPPQLSTLKYHVSGICDSMMKYCKETVIAFATNPYILNRGSSSLVLGRTIMKQAITG